MLTAFFFWQSGGEFTSPNQERFHHYKVKFSFLLLVFASACYLLLTKQPVGFQYYIWFSALHKPIGFLGTGPENKSMGTIKFKRLSQSTLWSSDGNCWIPCFFNIWCGYIFFYLHNIFLLVFQVLYKHKIIVFGGFYDTLREVRLVDSILIIWIIFQEKHWNWVCVCVYILVLRLKVHLLFPLMSNLPYVFFLPFVFFHMVLCISYNCEDIPFTRILVSICSLKLFSNMILQIL